jgi:CPA1 family monovalent cation:H+ antiporter
VNFFQAFALLISLTALFAYLNARFIRLPGPVGSLLIALVLSLGVVLFGSTALEGGAEAFLKRLDFGDLILQGLLSFLLFAGALNVDLESLNWLKWPILTLATVGLVLSTLVVGTLMYVLLGFFGLSLSYGYALLFGALISSTDPIAVLAILKQAGVSENTEALIIGESLFNDGVSVVVFSVILGTIAAGEHGGDGVTGALLLFTQEAAGGLLFGLVIGYMAYLLLKSIDNYTVEVLITLAVVVGGYALAQALHTSGPLAVVVAGLFYRQPRAATSHVG